MEPIFENITIETEQLMKEYILCVNQKRFRNNKIMLAICAAAFAYLGFEWDQWALYVGAAYYVVMFIWQFFVPGRNAKRMVKSKLAYYDQTNPPMTARFFEDHFEVSDVDCWHTYPYSKIQSVSRQKSFVLVCVSNGTAHPLSLDGFQKGTPEELVEFLRSKCPQLNPAHWNW